MFLGAAIGRTSGQALNFWQVSRSASGPLGAATKGPVSIAATDVASAPAPGGLIKS